MAGLGVASSGQKVGVLQAPNERREIIILRKPLLPKDDILLSRKKTKEVKTAPQPIAVARRNARERNRVKQVNNGFANLRQHIPNFIAAAFESNSRGGNKKLSKVETLRMAVEYIRSLEDILSLEDGHETTIMSNSSSISSFSSPSPSTITYHDDEMSTTSTPPPQQYSYQILQNHLYEDSENMEPLNVEDHILADPELMEELEFKGVQDLSLLNNMHSDSLSPGMYSEQSLSPGDSDHPARSFENIYEARKREVPVISVKTEQELPHEHKNVMDVMHWWEQQQPSHTIS